MYKEAIFSTNDLVGALPNNIISLCKNLKMYLSMRNFIVYLQFEELNIKFFSKLVHQFQFNFLLEVFFRIPKNFN
ncbi:hypothetical protein MA16_Dca004360 [Dendrobium catenatum]|uniref:Uncharacterized protein n=1 Tax=Dendrobium catenatum TaxID=906689 RepID=A0A2I0W783_9ASPA|nr:hypothetical protein MA16_Dca004360 [Dendrobium catenatum]